MIDSEYPAPLPPEQQAIRDKCFHPSGTFIEFPKEEIERSIPERFEKIVSKYTDRVAIKLKTQSVTYGELNCQANRLARSIIDQLGSKPEPIAVFLENPAALMAATLGVLKTGKFVVLLDPSFPELRNAAILEDSQAKLVTSDRQNAPPASRFAIRRCQLIDVESVDPGISATDLHLRITPEALAFLVYTSGSTGQPKGVMQDHRSRLHQFMWSTATWACRPAPRRVRRRVESIYSRQSDSRKPPVNASRRRRSLGLRARRDREPFRRLTGRADQYDSWFFVKHNHN